MENATSFKKSLDFAGRVTIPISIRNELNLKESSKVIVKTIIIEDKKYILLEKEGD